MRLAPRRLYAPLFTTFGGTELIVFFPLYVIAAIIIIACKVHRDHERHKLIKKYWYGHDDDEKDSEHKSSSGIRK